MLWKFKFYLLLGILSLLLFLLTILLFFAQHESVAPFIYR